MPTPAGYDRREHPRHPVRAYAQVMNGHQGCPVKLVDMSFNGARLTFESGDALVRAPLNEGDEISLIVELEDIQAPDISDLLAYQARKILRLRGTLIYRQADAIGVEYRPLSEVDQVLLTLLLAQPEQ